MAVARALLNRPGLLLCDEPTGSLDRAAAAAVADLLFELHEAERTILVVVTHSLELAARFARRCELVEGRCSSPPRPDPPSGAPPGRGAGSGGRLDRAHRRAAGRRLGARQPDRSDAGAAGRDRPGAGRAEDPHRGGGAAAGGRPRVPRPRPRVAPILALPGSASHGAARGAPAASPCSASTTGSPRCFATAPGASTSARSMARTARRSGRSSSTRRSPASWAPRRATRCCSGSAPAARCRGEPPGRSARPRTAWRRCGSPSPRSSPTAAPRASRWPRPGGAEERVRAALAACSASWGGGSAGGGAGGRVNALLAAGAEVTATRPPPGRRRRWRALSRSTTKA